MKSITALTLTRLLSMRVSDRIGVFCDNPKEICTEVQDFLYKNSAKELDFFHLQVCIGGTQVNFLPKNTCDDCHDRTRGYRFQLMLVEGNEHNIPKPLFYEVLVPMAGIVHNPSWCDKIVGEFGTTLPDSYIPHAKIIFSDENT